MFIVVYKQFLRGFKVWHLIKERSSQCYLSLLGRYVAGRL
jgi:hypothetical protein